MREMTLILREEPSRRVVAHLRTSGVVIEEQDGPPLTSTWKRDPETGVTLSYQELFVLNATAQAAGGGV